MTGSGGCFLPLTFSGENGERKMMERQEREGRKEKAGKERVDEAKERESRIGKSR